MNTYKPLRLIAVRKDGTHSETILREYALYNINISEMKLSGDYVYIAIEDVIDLEFYNGFYFEPTAELNWTAYDFRVNEGMNFAAPTKIELRDMIDSYMHGLAFEADKERTRALMLKAKEKAK